MLTFNDKFILHLVCRNAAKIGFEFSQLVLRQAICHHTLAVRFTITLSNNEIR